MKPLLVAAALLFCAAIPDAAAQSPASLSLEQLTWPELRDEIKAGKTTILVPIGGTEQNGPHMALGKHNVRAKALAERIAARLGNALVAPVIAYVPEGTISPPTAHMRYPGTITVPEDAFEKTLESAARSFLHHGFKDVVFLADHGGYQKSVKRVAELLNREGPRHAVHVPGEYYRELEHAGRDDTSLALAIDPQLVRVDRLSVPAKGDGVAGDPRGASAERGRVLVDAIVERTAESIRKATAR
ncbi:MAG: creatininase family protein [Usitatibacter sp.]